jgi:hypothetical protein
MWTANSMEVRSDEIVRVAVFLEQHLAGVLVHFIALVDESQQWQCK